MGLLLTPTVVYVNNQMQSASQSSTINADAREQRIAQNPKRAAAIAKGRKRLAASIAKQNEGIETLATLRLAAGISQSKLADLLGTQQPNIARMERRPGDLQVSTLVLLSQHLHASLDRVVAAITNSNKLAENGS